MHMTLGFWTKVVFWMSVATMTQSKPLPPPCIEPGPYDLLAMSLAESSALPDGVEVVKEKGVVGYRFDPEARLLGVPASTITTHCDYFPQEFSLVLTFKREAPRNENEYIMTLLGPDRQSLLLGFRLQRDSINLDFLEWTTGEKQTVNFQNGRLTDGEWHTLVISVSRSQVKFNLDCLRKSTLKLTKPFPRKLNTNGARFYIGSRRRKRNRFNGLLRQVKFIPGTDASIHLCPTSGSTSFPSWMGAQVFTTKKEIVDTLVMFDESDDVSMTCNQDNKGRLIYRKQDGNLQMCGGNTWMRLATTNERLDYVVDFGELRTKSKTLDIEVFEIPEEGLFLATANQGRDKNMNSSIYKWNDARHKFIRYQFISTDDAGHWEYFTIESEHFLAVANRGSNKSTPEAQSAIYRWSRKLKKFVRLQSIRTFDARSWESFSIDDKHYLAVANYASQRNHRQKSWVYQWDPDDRAFLKYQPLDTIGAYDFEYFQVGSNHFLAVANSYDGVKTRMDSVIYQWLQGNFVPLQYVETYGATDWEHFEISGRHFLAVANYYDNSQDPNTYLVDSYIFEYLPKINQFSKLQNIQTNGARDFEFFTVGKDSYLITSNSGDDVDSLSSVIYRWQGMEHFVPVHSISTSPCADWESFITNDGKQYLVSANVKTKDNKILFLMTY